MPNHVTNKLLFDRCNLAGRTCETEMGCTCWRQAPGFAAVDTVEPRLDSREPWSDEQHERLAQPSDWWTAVERQHADAPEPGWIRAVCWLGDRTMPQWICAGAVGGSLAALARLWP